MQAEIVADLHESAGRYPDDPTLQRLVSDLHALSPEFTRLWDRRPVRPRAADRKTVIHPEVELGVLTSTR